MKKIVIYFILLFNYLALCMEVQVKRNSQHRVEAQKKHKELLECSVLSFDKLFEASSKMGSFEWISALDPQSKLKIHRAYFLTHLSDISSPDDRKDIEDQFFFTVQELLTYHPRLIKKRICGKNLYLNRLYLRVLDLQNDQSFQRIQKFYLDHNNLWFLPEEISYFAHLKKLDVSHNQLKQQTYSVLQSLSQLKELRLSNTGLIEVPSMIGKLTTLKKLYLDCNPLKKMDYNLGSLINLKTLNVSHTTQELDAQILPLSIQTVFAIGRCGLLIKILRSYDFLRLPNLQNLIAGNNTLRSYKHREQFFDCGNLLRLTKIDFSGRGLTKLPASIGLLIYLTHLNLSDNKIESLEMYHPNDSLSKLKQLKELNLENNKIEQIDYNVLRITNLAAIVFSSLPLKLKILNLYKNPLEYKTKAMLVNAIERGDIAIKELLIDDYRMPKQPEELPLQEKQILNRATLF